MEFGCEWYSSNTWARYALYFAYFFVALLEGLLREQAVREQAGQDTINHSDQYTSAQGVYWGFFHVLIISKVKDETKWKNM